MTAESLGNWTYGYLGAAFGYTLPVLIGGSTVVAPLNNWEQVLNEFNDWNYIGYGHYSRFFGDGTFDGVGGRLVR